MLNHKIYLALEKKIISKNNRFPLFKEDLNEIRKDKLAYRSKNLSIDVQNNKTRSHCTSRTFFVDSISRGGHLGV